VEVQPSVVRAKNSICANSVYVSTNISSYQTNRSLKSFLDGISGDFSKKIVLYNRKWRRSGHNKID
jgi:hypothetical protein